MKEIRMLEADEIECRPSVIKENGLSLLLYKNARVDMQILDEVFGMTGWKRSHQVINGMVCCTVEIYDEEKREWVAKQDVGSAGSQNGGTEKEKTMASDSFKRACTNIGIGRSLYSAPFIWIPSEKAKIENRDGKYFCREEFRVKSISYSGNEISGLEIVNGKGVTVFGWKQAGKTAGSGTVSPQQMKKLEDELERTGVAMETVCRRYGIDGKPDGMSGELYDRIMKALGKTKNAEEAA